ncbi:hypothetical protein [Streptomyces poonensis]|uniref:Uncharacterized protein n=1 Tax=Streptomyces poonensis TaxID=68255 RepID=A0A918UCH3_9ACTN|nr:hypothetical protein [Streptomyces poonensis]GGY92028.1 hypothetical protein GCM10010365_08100 [Streptomyces poonensis]GLJ87752.1 hypothetical protein GCM10017589_03520 [Streptomyces poonensis]
MDARQDADGTGRFPVLPAPPIPPALPVPPERLPDALDVLLTTAVRAHAVDRAAEARAVAAYRTARDQGAHALRTRRRDDWRPPGGVRPR